MPLEIVEMTYHGRGYKLQVNSDSHIGGRIVQGKQPYELPLLEDMFEESRPGTTALDVGGHIGNHSLWMACVCELNVVAFEPNFEDASMLYRNAQLNGVQSNVKVVEAVLGDHLGTAVHQGEGRYTEGNSSTPMYTLDHWYGENIEAVSMIKIDVEGMEPEVIRGANKVLDRYGPVVYAEAQTEEARDHNAEALSAHGYSLAMTFDSKLVATPVDKWVKA